MQETYLGESEEKEKKQKPLLLLLLCHDFITI